MAYGIIKVDTVTFTNDGIDKSVSISGLVQNPTFSGNVTVTGTLSGVTVTGTTANFVSGVFSSQISGTTASFTSGVFANISGGTHTITSGVFAAGSAASPSISFTSDPDTGLYSPGANQLALSTSGAGQVFITSNGNAGIGTLNAGNVAGKLHLRADGDESKALLVLQNRNTGGSAGGAINFVNGAVDFSDDRFSYIRGIVTGAGQNGNHLVFGTNATGQAAQERLRITSAGLVGIGASSPVATLDVGGSTATSNGGLSNVNFFAGFTPTGGGNSFGGVAAGAGVNGNTPFIAATRNGAGTGLPLTFFTDGSERIRIDSSGNVGIGTASPSYRLDVVGNARIGATTGDAVVEVGTGATGNRNAIVDLVGDTTYTDFGLRLRRQDTGANTNSEITHRGTGTLLINAYDVAPIAFLTGNVERGRFDSSGRLLVGTSSIALGSPQTIIEKATSDLDILRVQCGASEVPNNLAGIAFGHGVNGSRPKIAIASVATGTYGHGSLAFYIDQAADNNAVSSSDEVARIDSSGRLLVGTSVARNTYLAAGISAGINVEGAGSLGANNRSLSIVNGFSGSADGDAILYLGRTRSDSIGGTTIVQNNDFIGRIAFVGSDGTNMLGAAQIRAEIDGTPGANDMPGRLVFSTTAAGASSPTERMRIESNATARFTQPNVNNDALTLDITNGSFAASAITMATARAGGTTALFLYGLANGVQQFIVFNNGDVKNTNNSYGAISDIKLKENIVDANSQWDDIKALQVRNYNFKEGQTHTQIGLVAQEVELVSPGLVSESPDRDEDGNDLGTVTKSVNYSVLYMKAVKALQEAMERIETLEQRLNDAGIN